MNTMQLSIMSLTLIPLSICVYIKYKRNKNNIQQYKYIMFMLKKHGNRCNLSSKSTISFIIDTFGTNHEYFLTFVLLSFMKGHFGFMSECLNQGLNPNLMINYIPLLDSILINYYNNYVYRIRYNKQISYALKQIIYFLLFAGANTNFSTINDELLLILETAHNASCANMKILYDIKKGNNPFLILPPIVWFNRLSNNLQVELLDWCDFAEDDILNFKLTFQKPWKLGQKKYTSDWFISYLYTGTGSRIQRLLSSFIIPENKQIEMMKTIKSAKYLSSKSGLHIEKSLSTFIFSKK